MDEIKSRFLFTNSCLGVTWTIRATWSNCSSRYLASQSWPSLYWSLGITRWKMCWWVFQANISAILCESTDANELFNLGFRLPQVTIRLSVFTRWTATVYVVALTRRVMQWHHMLLVEISYQWKQEKTLVKGATLRSFGRNIFPIQTTTSWIALTSLYNLTFADSLRRVSIWLSRDHLRIMRQRVRKVRRNESSLNFVIFIIQMPRVISRHRGWIDKTPNQNPLRSSSNCSLGCNPLISCTHSTCFEYTRLPAELIFYNDFSVKVECWWH